MNKREKTLLILICSALLISLVNSASSSFATIKNVILDVPSSVNIGQEFQVKAIVYTLHYDDTESPSHPKRCTLLQHVSNVWATLALPEGVAVTSSDNLAFIGIIEGGSSREVTWKVSFRENGTHTLRVNISGYDSGENTCSVAESATIFVGEPSPSSTYLEMLYNIVMASGMTGAVIFAVYAGRRQLLRIKTRTPPAS